jgi:outer membrane protein insertion porin family
LLRTRRRPYGVTWPHHERPSNRRRPWRASCAWGLCLALTLGIPIGVAQAQDEIGPELTRISALRFEGRHHVSAKELLGVMKTKKPSAWPWAEAPVLREDFVRSDTLTIAAVYRRHGYLDTHVGYHIEPDRESARAKVVFTIDEGPRSRVGEVRIEGSTAYPENALRRRLASRPGKPFNPSLVVADTTRISREYQNRGYIPDVEAVVERESTAVNLTYRVTPGPLYRFGQVYISVSGEPTVDQKLIRREIQIDPGDVYRYTRVEKTQEQLSETGYFRFVQLERIVDSTNAVVEWDLRLAERKPRWVDAGIGSGTAERFRFTGEWGNRNLMGKGYQGALSSRIAFDGRGRFLIGHGEASLLEPWLFGTRTRGQLTPYYERTTDRTNPSYRLKQDRRGLTLRAYRNFGRLLNFQLIQDNTFVTQAIDYNASELTSEQLADVDSALAATEPKYTTHRLRGILERDRRDFPLNPGLGSYQNVLGEVAGGPLQGSSSFLKFDVSSSWYTPLPNGWILATRLRAGAIDPFGKSRRFTPDVTGDAEVLRVPSEDRFRLGGVTTIRGYGEGEIPSADRSGGLAVLMGNIELRIPVFGPFGIEGFIDAGNVWDRPSYIKGRDLLPEISANRLAPGDVRYTFGFGGRLNLPFGPLRYDVAWGARPDANGSWVQFRRQIAIGPAF